MATPGGSQQQFLPQDDGAAGNPGDADIQRGIEFNSNKIPAGAEPNIPNEAGADEDAARPLKIDTHLVYRAQPKRSRAHYRAIFRAPQVARADVPTQSEWTPIQADAKLAASN